MHTELAFSILLVVTTNFALLDTWFFSNVLNPSKPRLFWIGFTFFSIALAMGLNIGARLFDLSVTGIYVASAFGFVLRFAVLHVMSGARVMHTLFAYASIQAGLTILSALIDFFGLAAGVLFYGSGYFEVAPEYARLEDVTLDSRTQAFFLTVFLFTLALYVLLVRLLRFAWTRFVYPLMYERIKLFIWIPVSVALVELSMNLYLGDSGMELVVYVLTSSTVVFGVPMQIYFLCDALSVMFAGVTVTVFYVLWKLRENEELLHVRRLVRDQLDAQSRKYEKLSRREQAVSKLWHDVKNIEAAALGLAEKGDISGAVRLLRQALDRLEQSGCEGSPGNDGTAGGLKVATDVIN